MRDFSIDDSISQLLIAQRLLSDVSGRLIREADDAALEASRRNPLDHQQVPILFCRYTSSLESLISQGNKYGTIYADPPWPSERDVEAGSFFRRKPISVEALAALPVRELAAPSCHLHIWTTDQFLLDARQMIETWGFTYKGSLVWIKPQLGDGDYWRVSHEYLLLGVRGDAIFTDYRPRSWFCQASFTLSDSKPFAVKALVERVSPGPRLTLFANGQNQGWTGWGEPIPSNDFDDDDEDDIQVPAPMLIQEAAAADAPLIVDAARKN